MEQANWSAVDSYIEERIVAPDFALQAALAANASAGLPAIDVSPPQGKLLQLLARMTRSRKVLEIGALGGYSTIWLARALPADGFVVTLEANPKHADVARENIRRAGLSGRVRLRVGEALDTLPHLEEEGVGPFDFVFIDADKQRNPEYFAWALRLAKPGTVIVCDNVVRDGAILDRASADPSAQGTRRMFEMIAKEPRVSATVVQTVGAKGWDGLLVAIVDRV
ncbi:MAG: O-methyltransferase [Hyphomicrobiales bacterium]|nr:O-methyltransferase [Hyphomicrobiales bacterium]